MKTINYNLYRKGRWMAKTNSLKVAMNLEQLGWSYQTVTVYT